MLPVQRTTRSQGGKRRSHDGLRIHNAVMCPACQKAWKRPHTACPACGAVPPRSGRQPGFVIKLKHNKE